MRLLRTRPPDAQEIMPGLLIGSAPDRRQCEALARGGVSLVVDLRAEATSVGEHWPSHVAVHHFPIADRHAPGLDELDQLVRRIIHTIGDGGIVLVHCEAGLGRTPTVGCAVLMHIGYDLSSAYRALHDRRPSVAPTDRQVDLLRRYERCRSEATDPRLLSPQGVTRRPSHEARIGP